MMQCKPFFLSVVFTVGHPGLGTAPGLYKSLDKCLWERRKEGVKGKRRAPARELTLLEAVWAHQRL
jgi:hypothetical protein